MTLVPTVQACALRHGYLAVRGDLQPVAGMLSSLMLPATHLCSHQPSLDVYEVRDWPGASVPLG